MKHTKLLRSAFSLYALSASFMAAGNTNDMTSSDQIRAPATKCCDASPLKEAPPETRKISEAGTHLKMHDIHFIDNALVKFTIFKKDISALSYIFSSTIALSPAEKKLGGETECPYITLPEENVTTQNHADKIELKIKINTQQLQTIKNYGCVITDKPSV